MAKAKAPPPIAVEDDEGEGEPQTVFLSPAHGGSYRRNPDGSLTLVQGPTLPPATQPTE